MSAICVNSVNFKYGKQTVLENFCAQVESGQIYALLGPSGGGKTTLLRLILGRIKLQQGFISVFGHKPGQDNNRISYMPQNSALCAYFTVAQTFKYFMHIYKISKDDFEKRYTKLQKLLELPPNDCVIHQLSGGQQRRISLAAALINNSSLVILDEPTVGIDLLIIQNIWRYLNIRCREGLTILFVTHYIEEATNAHRVGLMRNGRLLAEDNPRQIIEDFKESSLENVFLKLCLLDNKCNDSNNNSSNHSTDTNTESTQNSINRYSIEWLPNQRPLLNKRYISLEQKSLISSLVFNLWIILILMKRNILRYLHMNSALICILLPATQVVIYCLVYSKEVIHINAAIFNQELPVPEYSEDVLKSLVPIERHLINPVMYPTLEDAVSAVQNGKAIGVIWFKHNYSDSIDERMDNPLDIDQRLMDTSSLHLYLDNSMIMFGNAFMFSLRETLIRFLANLSLMKNQTNMEMPVRVEKTPFSENLVFKDTGLSANLIFYIYLSQIVLSSLVLTQERKDGLFERSLIAGVSHHLVLISHLLTNFLLSIVQIILMYLTAFTLFNEVNNGSDVLIICFLLTEALNAITSGLLISSIFKEEYHCLIILGFLCAPQLFTSGMFWPLESLDLYLQYASLCTPLAIPVETLRNIVLRGWPFTNISVIFGFAVNLVPSIMFIIMALYIFRYRE